MLGYKLIKINHPQLLQWVNLPATTYLSVLPVSIQFLAEGANFRYTQRASKGQLA